MNAQQIRQATSTVAVPGSRHACTAGFAQTGDGLSTELNLGMA